MSRTWRRVLVKHARGDRRRGSCDSGKIRYRTEEQAVTALDVIRNQPHTSRHTPVRAYLCPSCTGWHLSSSPTWEGNR